MDKPYRQQCSPTLKIKGDKIKTVCKCNIGQKYRYNRYKLPKGTVDTVCTLDKFIEQDYRCIKDCGTESKEYIKALPTLPTPVISTSPRVDITKHIQDLAVIFSPKSMGHRRVTITGAK